MGRGIEEAQRSVEVILMARQPIVSTRSRSNNYLQVVMVRRPMEAFFFDDSQPEELAQALDAARAKRTELRSAYPADAGNVRLIAWRRPSSGVPMDGVQFVGTVQGELN